LQNKIITNINAKYLAVRHVTVENKGKNTFKVDGKTYITLKEKWKLAHTLEIDGKASLINRVIVSKSCGIKIRKLGILTIKDMAKQKLVLMALDPE
jgi:RNA-directed DNA polymerase